MIRFETADGELIDGELWDVFAALSREAVRSFPALRPHQRMPVHAFFVQLAGIALRRAERTAPPTGAAAWRELLFALTPEWPRGEPWRLLVEDWTAPALLQPPVPEARSRAEYKPRQRTPDALDMLVTAKNHDLKAERVADRDDAWFFALVAVPLTAQGPRLRRCLRPGAMADDDRRSYVPAWDRIAEYAARFDEGSTC